MQTTIDPVRIPLDGEPTGAKLVLEERRAGSLRASHWVPRPPDRPQVQAIFMATCQCGWESPVASLQSVDQATTVHLRSCPER